MKRARDSGFTLLETLIALSIVAALASVTMLAIGGSDRGGPEAEARRLASRLQFAVDESLVTGDRLAMQWDDNRYQFVVWTGPKGGWAPSVTRLLKERTVSDALRLEVDSQDPRIEIGSDGFGTPILVSVEGNSQAWRIDFDGFAASVAPVLR